MMIDLMNKPLPEEFEKLIRDDIEKNVLPNLETMSLNHYEHLRVAYRPKDEESFLFAYVIGNLEANYHTRFIQDYGLGSYRDEQYFAIHRLITEYKDQISSKVKAYLEKH